MLRTQGVIGAGIFTKLQKVPHVASYRHHEFEKTWQIAYNTTLGENTPFYIFKENRAKYISVSDRSR